MALKGVSEHFSLESAVRDSIKLLADHTDPSRGDRDTHIPDWVLSECRGVAFLFTYKVGVFASASGGSGILIAKKPGTQEWGLPVAIGLGGIGGGLDFGVSRAYQIMVLNTDHAVRNFCQENVKLGASVGVAAGPVGRQAEGSARMAVGKHAKPVGAFTYGYSKGLFAGVGVQGMWVSSNDHENKHFYGLPHAASAVDCIFGNALDGCKPTNDIEALQKALTAAAASVPGAGTGPHTPDKPPAVVTA